MIVSKNGTKGVYEEAAAWILKLEEGHDREIEQAEFQKWYGSNVKNGEAFDELIILWDAPEFKKTVQETYEIQCSRVRKKQPVLLIFQKWQAVAALVLLCSFVSYMAVFSVSPAPQIASIYKSKIGEIREITLPDNSQISLNTESEISVGYDGNIRAVHLYKGEVFFQVTKSDIPFVITSDAGDIQVTGTAFSVRKIKDKLILRVKEGSVKAGDKRHFTQSFAAGQKAVLKSKKIIGTGEINRDKIALWTLGWIEANEMPILELLSELDRYYPQKIIIVSDLKNKKVSGRFHLDNIMGLVEKLASTFNLKKSLDQDKNIIIEKM